MKKIEKYTLGLFGAILSTVGFSNAQAEKTPTTPSILDITEESPLFLSNTVVTQENESSLDWHYSHSSHVSHYSHRSSY